MAIAIDFSGTVVEYHYPRIGEGIPFAVETLKLLQQERHRSILWSIREGELLDEAIEWCRAKGLEFYTANRNYLEEGRDHQGFSRKLKADLFIDDRNVGGILNWGIIHEMVKEKKMSVDIYSQQREGNTNQKKKREWLSF